MSVNRVKSDGSLEKIAGMANSAKINEMYAAFPSDASASNKLVTAQEHQIASREESSGYSYYKLTDFFKYTTSPNNHIEYFICGNVTYAQLEWMLIDSTFKMRAWYIGDSAWAFSKDGDDLYVTVVNYPFRIQRKTILGEDNKAVATKVTAIPSTATAITTLKLVSERDALIYYQSDSSSITDFDNAVPQASKGAIQMFYLGSDITNAPTSSGGGFIVIAEQLSTTYISQLATQIGTNNKYTRSKSTNGWDSWQKLVTESDLYAAETTVTVTSDSSGSGSSSNITLQRAGHAYYVIAPGSNYGCAAWMVIPGWSTAQIVKLGGDTTVTCTLISVVAERPIIQVGIINQPNVSISFQIKPV